MIPCQIIQGCAILTPEPEQVFKSGSRNQHHPSAATLEEGVGRHGRAVDEDLDRAWVLGPGAWTRPKARDPRPQCIQRPKHADARILGSARNFTNLEGSVFSDRDEIGECPADVYADARHGAKRRLTRSAIPATVSTTTIVPTQSPSRTYRGMTSLVRRTPTMDAISFILVWA